jgi:hypothetical protein
VVAVQQWSTATTAPAVDRQQPQLADRPARMTPMTSQPTVRDEVVVPEPSLILVAPSNRLRSSLFSPAASAS